MNQCPECGTKLLTQKFCQECGNDLSKYPKDKNTDLSVMGLEIKETITMENKHIEEGADKEINEEKDETSDLLHDLFDSATKLNDEEIDQAIEYLDNWIVRLKRINDAMNSEFSNSES